MYNAGDDLACDGLDEVERVLLHTYAPSASSALAPAAAASSSTAAPASASALAAEIRAGTDAMSEALLDAHVRPGDKFEVYCLMELFGLHGDLRDDVESMLVRVHARGAAASAR